MSTFLELVAGELGVPYVYGGDSPSGFDCSGLVQWAAAQSGVSLPRGATDQMHALPDAPNPGPGDLVFFNTGDQWEAGHVGICADNGCATMIDAPHSGANVRQEPVAGFAQVVGYRRLPITATNTAATATDAGIVGDLGGGLGGVLGGVTGGLSDLLGPITDLLAQFPADVLKVLLGGHTIVELALRLLELVGGALILATGAVMFLKVIAEGNEGAAVRTASSSTRRVARTVRGAGDRVSAATAPERAPRTRTRTDRRRLDALIADRGPQ